MKYFLCGSGNVLLFKTLKNTIWSFILLQIFFLFFWNVHLYNYPLKLNLFETKIIIHIQKERTGNSHKIMHLLAINTNSSHQHCLPTWLPTAIYMYNSARQAGQITCYKYSMESVLITSSKHTCFFDSQRKCNINALPQQFKQLDHSRRKLELTVDRIKQAVEKKWIR